MRYGTGFTLAGSIGHTAMQCERYSAVWRCSNWLRRCLRVRWIRFRFQYALLMLSIYLRLSSYASASSRSNWRAMTEGSSRERVRFIFRYMMLRADVEG